MSRTAIVKHDTFNEQVLIAAALTAPAKTRSRLLRRVRPELMIGDGHEEIWRAIRKADERNLEPTPAMIRRIGGKVVKLDYLKQLIQLHPDSPPNLGHHVATLEWDASRVRAVEGPLSSLMTALEDAKTSPERIRALARQVSTAFDGAGSGRHFMHKPEQLIRETLAEVDARREGIAVFPYGVPGMDKDEDGEWRSPPGAAPGKVTLLTGLSGAGKSTLAAITVLGLVRQKRRVLYGAWEMTSPSTLELLAAIDAGVSRYRLLSGKITDEERDRLEKAMRSISAYVRFWKFPWGRGRADRPRDNDEAADVMHGYMADSGAEVVVMDLLRRTFVDRSVDGEEWMLERLQTIGQEAMIHQVWVHQQRLKDIEQRADRRPTRDGIKGTSQWVDVPDTIFGVHLPSMFKAIPNDTFEIDWLKLRFGKWPIAVEYDWNPDLGRLMNPREIGYSTTASKERAEYPQP